MEGRALKGPMYRQEAAENFLYSALLFLLTKK